MDLIVIHACTIKNSLFLMDYMTTFKFGFIFYSRDNRGEFPRPNVEYVAFYSITDYFIRTDDLDTVKFILQYFDAYTVNYYIHDFYNRICLGREVPKVSEYFRNIIESRRQIT